MALADFAAEMDRCSQCSGCKWVPYDQVKSWRFAKNCPSISYHNFNSYSARGRYAVSHSLLRGASDVTPTVRDIAFSCLNCGACDVSCKICRYNLEPLAMARELKAHLVEQGLGCAQHEAVVRSLETKGNSLGQPRAERGAWARGLDVPTLADTRAPILLHVGCRLSYDTGVQGAARAAVHILKQAGVAFGILGSRELCCGGRLYSMGRRDDFLRLARANLAAWEKAGVRTVITACADCFHAFRRLYAPLGSRVDVIHMVELVDRLIAEGKLALRSRLPLTVTYHDPCNLGRQGEPHVSWTGRETKVRGQIVVHEPRKPRYNGSQGVYDAPRRVLKSIPGVQIVEMERIREYAWCCGAGGGVREASPELARWTARERIEEAKASGAKVLASACPWCERSFRDALAPEEQGSPRVADVLELVHEAL
jgi:Fe-S oxidoreductase